jgi:hypothetical protein
LEIANHFVANTTLLWSNDLNSALKIIFAQPLQIISLAYILSFAFRTKPKSMKTILISAALVALCSCAARQELQVQMVNARLVKVDTVYRFNTDPQKQLTWKDDHEIEYITFAALSSYYPIGTKMMVLIRR